MDFLNIDTPGKRKMQRFPWRIYISAGLIAAITWFILFYLLWANSRITNHYLPLMNATINIKSESATGHLWLEEILAGDANENPKHAMTHLENGRRYLRALLYGGEKDGVKIDPVRDSKLRKIIQEALTEYDLLMDFACKRLQTPEKSRLGSKVDQMFDKQFTALYLDLNKIERCIEILIRSCFNHFMAVMILLLAVELFLSFFMAVMLHLHHNAKYKIYREVEVSRYEAEKTANWLYTVMESMVEGVIITDGQGNIGYINPAAENMLQTKLPEVKGKNVREIYHTYSADNSELENPVIKVLEDKSSQIQPGTTLLETPGGNRIHIDSSTAPIINNQDQLLGAVLIIHDISESYKIHKELAKRNAEFRSLVTNVAGVYYRCKSEPGWPVEYISGYVEKITGYKPEEFTEGKRNFSSIIHPDDREKAWNEINDDLKEKDTFASEYRIIAANGEIKWIVDRGWLPPRKTGIGMIEGVAFDITDKKEVEVRLMLEKERLRNFLDIAGVMIVVLGQDGNVSIANRKTCEILGCEESDIVGKNWFDFALPEDNREGVKMVFSKIISGELKPFEYVENKVLTKDKEERIIAWSNSVLKNETGGIVATISSGEDITARKAYEDEREELINELKSKNTELERFTYTVSHDLKSPLITIKGFTGHLKRDMQEGKTDYCREDIERITAATDHMQGLLEDLLHLSRVGRKRNSVQKANLGDLVQEVIDNQLAGVLGQANAEIKIEPGLPEVTCDVSRIREVFQNLIENSLKFMDDDVSPMIVIGCRMLEGSCIIYVKDNGVGIPEEYHGKIFEIFDKLDPKTEGSGIGLAVVKTIIELHNGRIWVESEGAGKGATFCFTLGQQQEEW